MFARFKKHFTDMITVPVVLDGREAFDYTPTQVVAEWLRWVPVDHIDGIAWPSHLTDKVNAEAGPGEPFLQVDGDDGSAGPRNIALFYGHGTDFQSDPPTTAELARLNQRHPTLTLSADDITMHRVVRSVQAQEIEQADEDEDDPNPMFMTSGW